MINTKIWDDKYYRSLDGQSKLLFLYLLTNPLTNIAGAYEITEDRIAFDTGFEIGIVRSILTKFKDDNKAEYRDGWLLMLNVIKHQRISNEKIRSGIASIVSCCPDWIKDRLCIAHHSLYMTYQDLSHLNRDLNRDLKETPLPPTEQPSPEIEPEGDDLIPEKEIVPASEFGEPRNSKTKPTLPYQPPAPEKEIIGWLDAVAPMIGAGSRRTMANARRWRDVVESAITEKHDLTAFLAAVAEERKRTRGEPQFFSPDAILKILQLGKTTKKANGFTH